MTWKSGVTLVSFVAPKTLHGVAGGDFPLIHPRRGNSKLRRKRARNSFSKHRYLSAQMARYLRLAVGRTWHAAPKCCRARLASGLREKGAEI